MTNGLSAKEFLQHLNSNSLSQPITLMGMVQKKDESSLLFAESTNSETWIKIPAKFIEHVEYIDKVTVGENNYAGVKISLKTPDEKNEEATMYARLFSGRKVSTSCNCGHSASNILRTRNTNPHQNDSNKVCIDWPVIVCTEEPSPIGGYMNRVCHVEVGKFCW